MTDMELYAVPIPEAAQSNTDATAQQAQALQAILDSDSGNVDAIASEPGERTLTVEYPDAYADVRAAELRELATGLDQPLPYHAQSGTSTEDRYVTVASGREIGPIDPRGSGSFARATVELSDTGTPRSHWRTIRTDQVQVDHPWGNAQDAPVGVPADATQLQWLNPDTGATEEPTVQATRAGAHRDVDVLHAEDSSFTAPDVIYDIALADIGWTDPRVWDDRGNSDVEDANGDTQWQKVFSTDHRYDGQPIITNGLLRLTVDEPNNSLTAEEWDTASSAWSSVSLGSSDWELDIWEIRTIGLAQVAGVAQFRDTTQSPTATHTLDWQLARGYEDVLFATGSTAVPSGLDTLLDPIAADHIYDPYGDVRSSPQGLRAREEVLTPT